MMHRLATVHARDNLPTTNDVTRQPISISASFTNVEWGACNESISWKLCVMIGPTSRKNWLTFGEAPIPGMDSGSIFHFISISHTVTDNFYETWHKWRWQQGNESTTFFGEIQQTSGSWCGLIQQSGLQLEITFGWNFGRGLHPLSTVLLLIVR